MLTFEQFLQNAAGEGRSVNCLWEERLFDVLGVTEKITVPLTTQGIPHGGEYRCMEISNFRHSARKPPFKVIESAV
jgi:hypothetical protein